MFLSVYPSVLHVPQSSQKFLKGQELWKYDSGKIEIPAKTEPGFEE